MDIPAVMEQRVQVLRRLHDRLDGAAERALRDRHGLSVSEYVALAALAGAEGGSLRQQELAAAIPLRNSSVTRLVGRLERAGLSERRVCDSDRRGVYTRISAKGRRVVEAARRTYLESVARTLDDARHSAELSVYSAYLYPRRPHPLR
ncbi:DNA-binding MarR family transcriptional regulator [Thermocatellispora tengchongensis]|uniref:DNA-binding MarR family transcriptional regulator n=1 Tax=Thermocatellispora tengchongensis TaxID=1073253 RepID=A0A840NVB7_9ACTN|nr:MarR family transcriptional regulator [Thermocatellispora tengchongensis]MBB5131478.1 DNA-binding MarR family transcriptional regulator [Thermocatellispora tengchongensis]